MKSSQIFTITTMLNIFSQIIHIPYNYTDNEFAYTFPSCVQHKTFNNNQVNHSPRDRKLTMELSNIINIYKKNLIIVTAIHTTPSSY